MAGRLINLLSRLHTIILAALIAAAGIVEAFLLLLTAHLIDELTDAGADAADKRLEENITWSLGFFFIVLSTIGALVILALYLAIRRKRHPR